MGVPAGNTEATRGLGKNYLVDTCVLAKYVVQRTIFREEFDRLEREGFLCTNEAIQFEFSRGKIFKEQRDIYNEITKKITVLSLEPEVRRDALTIAQIYKSHSINEKQISYIDVLNASMAKKFHRNLLIMILDIQDYPPCLFDTIRTYGFA